MKCLTSLNQPDAARLERLLVQDVDVSAFEPYDSLVDESVEMLVHALARRTHHVGKLLLCDSIRGRRARHRSFAFHHTLLGEAQQPSRQATSHVEQRDLIGQVSAATELPHDDL